MKLFLISQIENGDYDTFDSAVVAAKDEEAARRTHPRGLEVAKWCDTFSTWASSPEKVKVVYLGEAQPKLTSGVICASFNAG